MACEARYHINKFNLFKEDVFNFGVLYCDILTSIEDT